MKKELLFSGSKVEKIDIDKNIIDILKLIVKQNEMIIGYLCKDQLFLVENPNENE